MLYKSHLLTLETIGYSWIHIYCDEYWFMGPRGRFTHGLLYWIAGTGYIQVIYRLCTKGRAPRTKETLPVMPQPDIGCQVRGHIYIYIYIFF